jgi:hypothetical protein
MAIFNILGGKFRSVICIVLATMMCSSAFLWAAKKPGKDRLAEALNLLNQAKESSSPSTFLYQAKDEVEGTLIPHKDAEREKAIKAIEEAISAATLHTKEKETINKAIASVRSLAGMGNGKKKK